MRLLVVTQIMDPKDSVLGFFHGWVAALAPRYESVSVICLQGGGDGLPDTVRVDSLGKQSGERTTLMRRIRFIARFYRALFRARGSYDAVLVHMNQEYILLAGWYWLLVGTPVYLWRNHYAGSLLTDIAASFCRKVFCTSRYSYTAAYRKTVRMPVGTDAKPGGGGDIARAPRSILSLGRIAPSKNIHVIVDALLSLRDRGVLFQATIRGMIAPQDEGYAAGLRDRVAAAGASASIVFAGAVPKDETFRQYQSHEIFVNASPSGMLDKTIFSAMMNGCIALASSGDFAEIADARCTFVEGDAVSLAASLERLLALPETERAEIARGMRELAQAHTLPALIDALVREMS